MYFGVFSLFIVLGHMILLYPESPDMQLSNHQKFLFGNSLPVASHLAKLLFLTLLTAVYITWLLIASSGSPG